MKKLLFIIALIFFIFPVSVSATSGACSYHGGVNCSIVSSLGNAICNDGWESSTSFYNTDECKTTCTYPSGSGCTNESEYSALQAQLFRDGTMQYSSGMADGFLSECRSQISNYQMKLVEYNNCLSQKITPKIIPSIPTCPDNSHLKGTSCYCNDGYIKKDNSCVIKPFDPIGCPENSFYIKAGTCLCNISNKQIYNKDKNICQNPDEYCAEIYSNAHFNYDGYINLTSIPPIGCECNNGYTKNSSGQCIKIETVSCPTNSTRDSKGCFCNDGYTVNMDKNGCMLIPKLETPKTTTTTTTKKQVIQTPTIKQPNINTAVKEEINQKIEDKPVINAIILEELSTTSTNSQDNRQNLNDAQNTINKQSLFSKITQNIRGVFTNIFKKLKFW